MKLKRKIFLIFSLIAIIPMCFLTTYTVYQYTEIIDTRVEDIANEQQQNISDAVSSAYTSIRQVMMLLIFARACLKNKNCTKRMFHFPFS